MQMRKNKINYRYCSKSKGILRPVAKKLHYLSQKQGLDYIFFKKNPFKLNNKSVKK